VEIGLSTVDTPKGQFTVATVVDISERLNAEERLRQASRLEAVGRVDARHDRDRAGREDLVQL
jgi:hypothetical protein